MTDPRLFLCNGAKVPDDDPLRVDRQVIELNTHGSQPNVNIQLQDVAKVFMRHLTPRLTDLIEIAAVLSSKLCLADS